MFFIDTSFGTGTTPSWYLVGKDIEDMSVDLGADTETIKNILDEVSVRHNGYEPSIEAEPFYADPSDPLYPKLKDIALNRKKGEDCKTKYLEVIVEDTKATSHSAWQEDCLIVPQSYGGDTSGFQIPFNVLPDGNRQQGTATLAGKVPTFTA